MHRDNCADLERGQGSSTNHKFLSLSNWTRPLGKKFDVPPPPRRITYVGPPPPPWNFGMLKFTLKKVTGPPPPPHTHTQTHTHARTHDAHTHTLNS